MYINMYQFVLKYGIKNPKYISIKNYKIKKCILKNV
jgi:hypothetical protein